MVPSFQGKKKWQTRTNVNGTYCNMKYFVGYMNGIHLSWIIQSIVRIDHNVSKQIVFLCICAVIQSAYVQ